MDVLNYDEREGCVGASLPRHSSSIVAHVDSIDIDMTLIKTVIKTNNQIRASYNTKLDSGVEQSIIYK